MPHLIGLEPTAAPNRLSFTVTREVSVGPGEAQHLFGGAALGAAASALERVCGRPLVWASAHFLQYTPVGQTLELEVEVLAEGRNTTQASVTARLGAEIVYRVSAALGRRPTDISGQWSLMPPAQGPQAYSTSPHWRADDVNIHSQLEVRPVKGRYGRDRVGAPEADGRLLIWVRPKSAMEVDAALLAVLADLLPGGVGNALGLNAGGNSLDNTLRVLQIVPTQWVLAEVIIQGVQNGFAHGAVRMFAETGELMAVASQSLIMRLRDVG